MSFSFLCGLSASVVYYNPCFPWLLDTGRPKKKQLTKPKESHGVILSFSLLLFFLFFFLTLVESLYVLFIIISLEEEVLF